MTSMQEALIYFCGNAQTTITKSPITCYVVTLVCLVAISSHLREVNLNNFASSLTRPMISLELALVLSPKYNQWEQASRFNFDYSSGKLAGVQFLIDSCRLRLANQLT